MNKQRFVLTKDGIYKNITPKKINYVGYIESRNESDKKFYTTRMKVLEDYFANLFEPIILKITRSFKPPLKVLDLGCGDGLILKSIHKIKKKHKLKIELFGLDIDKNALKKIKIPAKLSSSSMLKTPYKNDFFNLIICSQTLEHVTLRELKLTLKEVYRILAIGGVFYSETPNPISFLAKVMGNSWWMYLPEHLTLIPPKILKKMLFEAGFKNARGKTRLEIDSQMNEIRELILRKKLVFFEKLPVRTKYIILKAITFILDKGSITVGIATK